MQTRTWIVKNLATHQKQENLSEEALVSFLASLPPTDLSRWHFAETGSKSFFPGTKWPSLRLRRFGLPPIPPELKMTHEQIDWLDQQLELKEFTKLQEELAHEGTQQKASEPAQVLPSPAPTSLDKVNWSDRRQHTRKNIKIQVVLISDEHAFRTFTRDVSLGGLALEKAVPQKLLGTECSIFLSLPGSTHKFTFTGKVLAEAKGSDAPRHRIKFGELPSLSQAALNKWIEELEEVPKKAA